VVFQAQHDTAPAGPAGPRIGNPIAVSTYSFWRFLDNAKLKIETCIRSAAEMGFDAVEILEMQMDSTDRGYLQRLKREAFLNGLSLCGLSTHQTFVSPDPEKRQANIAKTIASIELAYQLGIPTMRVNTGRWGTSKDFDELMRNRGIEPPLPGFTDEDAFPWVIGLPIRGPAGPAGAGSADIAGLGIAAAQAPIDNVVKNSRRPKDVPFFSGNGRIISLAWRKCRFPHPGDLYRSRKKGKAEYILDTGKKNLGLTSKSELPHEDLSLSVLSRLDRRHSDPMQPRFGRR
jgi:hypothetical protein